VVPNGSSGTHAGLAAGFNALGISSQLVKSFAVHSPAAETRQATLKKARATALLVGAGQIGEGDIEVAGEQRGEGYGIPTAAMLAALRLVASREGLLLDPVYSGKAFAGLLEDVRRAPPSCGNVLFIMTGGVPSIFSYRSVF
jgi:L-cysteate sulfo-lyase